MAELLLIQPHTGTWDEMSIRPPESLLAVANIPYHKGIDVKIIDQRVTPNFEEALAREINDQTKLIGITVITGPQIKFALEVSQYLKSKAPHLPICWGGVHATLVPEQTAAHPLVDFVIVGDGDFVFCELFERLRDGRSVEDLRGLVHKTPQGDVRSNVGQVEIIEGKSSTRGQTISFVRRNGVADVIKNLDELPSLPYALIDLGKYNVFVHKDGRTSCTFVTSRGCPFRCKFCSDPYINEGAWRGLSAENVLTRVDYLYKEHGVRSIFFQDDYFPGPLPRFLKILEGLKKYKRDLHWSTLGIRADTLSKLNDEQWDLLYESGCFSLDIGIESGNERVIKLVNKAETLDEMRATNRKLARYPIKVKYTLIVGYPGETEEEMNDTVRFALELQDSNPNCFTVIFNYLPIIGTPFFQDAVKKGFKAPAKLEDWANMEFDTWLRNYQSWSSPRLVKKLEAISFTSYFANANIAYKFNSPLLRFCFKLYHPVAKWRFRNQYWTHFIEFDLKELIFKVKFGLRRLLHTQNAALQEMRERMALTVFDTQQ